MTQLGPRNGINLPARTGTHLDACFEKQTLIGWNQTGSYTWNIILRHFVDISNYLMPAQSQNL